ncbi:MAG: MFS transporter [Legionellales bacterium]|nr:MFS transporter [Legionellales bacterium]
MKGLLIDISKKQAVLFASFLVLYEFLTYVANDMIMPGMIKVVASFRAPQSAIALSLTAYVLGGASLQLILGPISDRYGRRPVMLFGAFFFFLCSLLIACTGSITQFLVARFFQGMGLCFIAVIGYATLQEIFDEMNAIRLIAIMANVAIIAPLLGPLLGAIYIYYFNWRYIFVAIALLALFALWGLWRFMPEPVEKVSRVGGEVKRGFSIRGIAANYKDLLMNRPFILGSISLGLIYMPCLAWIGLSPVMLVTGAGLTILQYALWQLPVFGTFILGNLLLHRMTHRKTMTQLIWVGSWIAAIGLGLVCLFPLFFDAGFIWLMPGFMLYFLGGGMISAPLCRYILFVTKVSKGTASALMSMISMCIQGLGIELANALYSAYNNLFFGWYCALVALAYVILLSWSLQHRTVNTAL